MLVKHILRRGYCSQVDFFIPTEQKITVYIQTFCNFAINHRAEFGAAVGYFFNMKINHLQNLVR